MFETTVTAVGTLITAIDKRYLFDGTPVASFRIACNERKVDRATGAWTNGDTLFLGVTCWRRLADHVHMSFASGDPIIVRGRIYTRGYDSKDGKRMSVTEMEADAVGPDLNRSTAVVTRMRRAVENGAEIDQEATPVAGPAPVDDRDRAGQDGAPALAVPAAGQ